MAVLIIVVVLFLHELGHAIGMRVFGYRNVRIFFVPLMGAVTSGSPKDPNSAHKAIVSLLGPLPGIILGVICWILFFATHVKFYNRLGVTFLFLNLFNLLPLAPLDGEKFFEYLLFARNAKLELAFKILTTLLLGLVALALKSPLLGILALFGLLSLKREYVNASLAQKLRGELPSGESFPERAIPPAVLKSIGVQLEQKSSELERTPKIIASRILDVWQRAHNRAPSLRATVGLLFLYFGSLFLVAFFARVFAVKIQVSTVRKVGTTTVDGKVVSPAEVTLATREVSLGKVHAGLIPKSLTVSPDSKRVAYAAQRGDKWLAVVDGVEGKEYDGAGTLVFSPDSKRVAYAAQRGDKWLAVADGVEGKEYDGAGTLVFSPDSKRVAYAARRGGKWWVIVDGVEGKEYDEIGAGSLVFSPDSKRVAYEARRGSKRLVVVDSVEEKEYDEIGVGNVFSPDSKRVAYEAWRGGKRLVVGDGVEGKEYDEIGAGSLVFSPDSKRVAYEARPGSKRLVVVDSVEEKEYDEIGVGNVFSPDSKRVAYAAQRGGKWLAVVDGVEGKEYDGIGVGNVFSPDSKRVAYAAQRGDKWWVILGKWWVVVDGVAGKEYDGIEAGSLVFSPDSKRVAYAPRRGGKRSVAVDGVEGKEYDGFLKGSRLVFDGPSQLHTLALRGGEILRVEVEVVTPAAKPSGSGRPHL